MYTGDNTIEFDGNVSILSNSLTNIFPLLFVQNRDGGWGSVNKNFPLLKFCDTKSKNFQAAALLEDKRNFALVEEVLDASLFIRRQILNAKVVKEKATKVEQDALLAHDHLEKYTELILQRIETTNCFFLCNEQLEKLKSHSFNAYAQSMRLSYKIAKNDDKPRIANNCLELYQQYDLKKKDFDDAYTKFILASGKLSEASELLFLNASKYIQKWTIDNVQVEEYLENQEASWRVFLDLENSGDSNKPAILENQTKKDYAIFGKRIKNFYDLIKRIETSIESEDLLTEDLNEHIKHITAIRNQLEAVCVEYDVPDKDSEILNVQCPKILKTLNKKLNKLTVDEKAKDELRKNTQQSNLRAMSSIKLVELNGFEDYLSWLKSQKYLNTHVDPYKKAACLLSTLKNQDDIKRCSNIYNYGDLMEILKSKYAKLPKLIPAMMNKLRRLPNPTNTTQMKDNISTILNIYTQLKSISESAVAHFDATVVEDLVLKLTFSYQLKYEEFVDSTNEFSDKDLDESPDENSSDYGLSDNTNSNTKTNDNKEAKLKRLKFIFFLKKIESHLANVSARCVNLDSQSNASSKLCKKCKQIKCKCKVYSNVNTTQVEKEKVCVCCDTRKPHINKYSKKATKSLASCPKFRALTLSERKQIVNKHQLCNMCLGPNHKAYECKIEGQCLNCSKGKHSYLLCNNETKQTTEASNTELVEVSSTTTSGTLLFVAGCQIENNTKGGYSHLNTLFDNASTDSFILESEAVRLGYVGYPVKLNIGRVGLKPESISAKQYYINLMDNNEVIHQIQVYSVPRLGYRNKIPSKTLSSIANMFKVNKSDINNPNGKISLLIGAQHHNIFPMPVESKGKLGLYRSLVGKPLMVIGSLKGFEQEASCNFVEIQNTRSFWLGDTLGLNTEPKCSTCIKAPVCKSCKYLNMPLSYQEQEEAKIIRGSMIFNYDKKTVNVSYPYLKDPSIVFPPDKSNFSLAEKMAKNLKRSLDKDGLTSLYTDNFMDMLHRGVIKELTFNACKIWENDGNPVNYCSHHAVLKDTSVSTKCRSVCNSSLNHNNTSLNALLPKGPKALSNLLHVILRFRSRPYVLVGDLKKAYNSIKTSPLDMHLRRLLWYKPEELSKENPKLSTFGMLTVAFGDTPAQYYLEACKEQISKYCADVLKNKELAYKILSESYVDDLVMSFELYSEAEKFAKDLPEAFQSIGFSIKEIILAGVKCNVDHPSQCLFGHIYHFNTDKLEIKFVVNLSKKKRNQRTAPNLTSNSDLSQIVLTKRTYMSLLGSQYDPLGLASVFLSKYKIFLHQLYKKEYEMDEPLNTEDSRVGMKLLKELISASESKLLFPRSNKSEGYKLVELVCFADASTQCLQVVLYGVYRNDRKETHTNLLSAKNKICNNTVPRNELNALVAACRLVKNFVIAIEDIHDLNSINFISDSTCAIDMLGKTFVTKDIYIANRNSEIKVQIKNFRKQCNFFWVDSANNIADFGTRTNCSFEFLNSNLWKHGPNWIKSLNDSPAKLKLVFENNNIESDIEVETFHTYSNEVSEKDVWENLLERTNSLNKVLRVYNIVKNIIIEKSFRAKRQFTIQDMSTAFKFFLRLAQAKIPVQKLKTKQLLIFEGKDGIYYTKLRFTDKTMQIVFNKSELPVLSSNSKLSKLLLLYAHTEPFKNEKIHCSYHQTLVNSRCGIYGVWITHGKQAVKSVIHKCVTCNKIGKKLQNAVMADRKCEFGTVPPDGSCFNHIAMDYFGPLQCKTPKYKTTRNSKTYKIYGLVVLCQQTRAIAIYPVEGYDTSSFLVAFKMHCALRGLPTTVLSDPMSSFISGSKLLTEDNVNDVNDIKIDVKILESFNISWNFIPPGSQWRDPAERSVKSIKNLMASLFTNLTNSNCLPLTISEYHLLFSEIAEILNRRPIEGKIFDDSIDFITPNSLLLGRTSKYQPINTPPNIVEGRPRLKLINDIKNQFWDSLIKTIAGNSSLFKYQNWYKQDRLPQEGDIVLLCYKGKLHDNYRIGKITHTHDDRRNIDLLVSPLQDGTIINFKKAIPMLKIPIQRTILLLPNNPIEDAKNKKDED